MKIKKQSGMKWNIEEKILIGKRNEVATKIKNARKNLGCSQEELAAKLGIARTTITKIENGQWNFGIDTLIAISCHLDIELIVFGNNKKSKK